MYYEEAVINGVLHIRSTPNGEWKKLTAEEITLKYIIAEQRAAEQGVHLTGLQSPPKCTTEKLCPVHNVWHAAPPTSM